VGDLKRIEKPVKTSCRLCPFLYESLRYPIYRIRKARSGPKEMAAEPRVTRKRKGKHVQIVGLIEDIVHTPNTVIDAPLGGIASSDASRPSAKLPLGLICAAEDAAQNRSQSKGPCCPAAYDCRLNA
jgi:hypothetical protein